MLHPPSGLFMTGSGIQQPFATANGRNHSGAKKALKQIVAGGCAGQFIDVMPHLPHQRGRGGDKGGDLTTFPSNSPPMGLSCFCWPITKCNLNYF